MATALLLLFLSCFLAVNSATSVNWRPRVTDSQLPGYGRQFVRKSGAVGPTYTDVNSFMAQDDRTNQILVRTNGDYSPVVRGKSREEFMKALNDLGERTFNEVTADGGTVIGFSSSVNVTTQGEDWTESKITNTVSTFEFFTDDDEAQPGHVETRSFWRKIKKGVKNVIKKVGPIGVGVSSTF